MFSSSDWNIGVVDNHIDEEIVEKFKICIFIWKNDIEYWRSWTYDGEKAR